MLELEYSIASLEIMKVASQKVAEALMDSPEEVEIRKWLVEEATQSTFKNSVISFTSI
jgi:isopentenyldiphosphate isomerase